MNLISIGLDIETFSEQKKAVLNEFISIFNSLEKYENLKVNPVLGEGLTAFNNSVVQTSALLDEMQGKLNSLGGSISGTSSISSQGAKSQTELQLAVSAYNKEADNAARLQAKLSVLTSDQAKETMALKLQLSEVTKQLLEEAKANNVLSSAKEAEKQKSVEYREEQRRVVETLRLLAIEQDKQAAQKEKLNKQTVTQQKQQGGDYMTFASNLISQETAAKEKEDKATRALISDYAILKKALQDQVTAYQNLYLNKGKNAPETLNAYADVAATSGIIKDIDGNLDKATGRTKLFGGALSSMFGQLRTLAYILPGIGLAGLFNLAFEAIEKVAEETGLFNDKLSDELQLQTQVNNSLLEQFNIYKKITEQRDKLYQETDKSSSTAAARIYSEASAKGLDADVLSNKKIEELKVSRDEAFKKLSGKNLSGLNIDKDVLSLFGKGGIDKLNKTEIDNAVKSTTASIDLLINSQKTIQDKITELDKVINTKDERDFGSKLEHIINSGLFGQGEKVVGDQLFQDGKNVGDGVDEIFKKRAEAKKAELQLQQTANSDALNNLSNFNNSQKQLSDEQFAQEKLIADERRKVLVESTRDEISVNIEKNRKVLSDERSTKEERISAIKEIARQEKELSSINRFNITDNVSSTKTDKNIAIEKEHTENLKTNIKLKQSIEQEDINFYQRYLKSTTELTKDEVEKSAIENEKIFKNQEKSLTKRLTSYTKYIIEKKHLDDLDAERDVQKGSSKLGGKTSLTPEETIEIQTKNLAQQANKQADAEKQVYDIVYQSSQKELKDIINFNILTETTRKEAYTTELKDLNDNYDAKKISLEKYNKERFKIDRKYAFEEIDNHIKDDEFELNRLQNLLDKQKKAREQAKNDVDITSAVLDTSKQKLEDDTKKGAKPEILLSDKSNILDAKLAYDTAVGNENAINDAIIDSDKKLKEKQDELDADRLKREKLRGDLQVKTEKEIAKAREEIIEALYKLVKTLIDAEYQKRLELLELNKRIVDEEYGNEIAAIDKSSLSAKDKAALDIQLNAEKQARDKDAVAKERELKRDQAIIDKELSIAHILWKTGEAVMNALALPLPPPAPEILAKERGAIGLIEAATVAAEPIPYAKGTPVGGHQSPEKPVLIGEAGLEKVKEPYKSPYFVNTPTITFLPKGTDVIPIKDIPEFTETTTDNSWAQTKWLAKQISKSNRKEIKNVFKPTIKIDLSFELHKKQILGN